MNEREKERERKRNNKKSPNIVVKTCHSVLRRERERENMN